MVDLEPIDVPPGEAGGDPETGPPSPPGRGRTRLVVAAGATVVVLLAGGLAALLVVDRSRPAGNVLSGAFARTARAGSARIVETITATGSTPDEPPVQATKVEGVVAFEPVRGTLQITTGAAAFAGAPGTTTLVLTRDALFTRSDAVPADAHGGRHWFRSGRTDGRIPGPFSIAATFSNNAVRGPASGVRRVGTEQIDGAATTRYRAHLLLQGHDPLELDVWVDGTGRIRRFRESTVGSPGSRFEMTVDYTDLGVAVPDDTPPASDVTDGRSVPPPPGVIDAA